MHPARLERATYSSVVCRSLLAKFQNFSESAGREIPNANVNMEYGLMLGFNKYVIPFQRASQTLPFNVGGLDTIKYGNAHFERLAIIAIDQAIRETQQDAPPPLSPDQILGTFLLTKKALVTPINNQGESTIFQLGWSLGFNLLNDFSGMTYMYFGNFTSLRPEVLVWRVKLLIEILDERRATLHSRVPLGIATEETVRQAEQILRSMQIWVVVTSNEDKKSVKVALGSVPYSVGIFSLDDVQSELENLGRIGA